MKIGFFLSFIDLRNDIRRLIIEVSKNSNVIIFVKPEHENLILKHFGRNANYRIINEQQNTVKNYLYSRLFLLMKRLPRSKRNYYLMEIFKANGLPTIFGRLKANAIITLQKLLPHFVSYDYFLNKISHKAGTEISDLDKIITFTEIYDDYFYSRLIKSKIPVFTYVYSWDHPFKQARFSKNTTYLVWHDGIAEDLITMHGILPQNIVKWGSTQLGFIDLYLKSPNHVKYNFNYFYFACGIGIPSLVESEIKLIINLYNVISRIHPNYKLIVRPYPNLKNWSVYEKLAAYPNIVLDNNFRSEDFAISEANIIEKLHCISNAKAFFHTGTTLGMEACFTNCPVFLLAVAKNNYKTTNIFNFINQFQNVKYLIRGNEDNTITNYEQLEVIIKTHNNPKYLIFSKKIRAQFPVASFEQLAKQLY